MTYVSRLYEGLIISWLLDKILCDTSQILPQYSNYVCVLKQWENNYYYISEKNKNIPHLIRISDRMNGQTDLQLDPYLYYYWLNQRVNFPPFENAYFSEDDYLPHLSLDVVHDGHVYLMCLHFPRKVELRTVIFLKTFQINIHIQHYLITLITIKWMFTTKFQQVCG